jgi:hypothetical protein
MKRITDKFLYAIDIIEPARSYYLLAKDHHTKPILVGNRIKLEFALENIPEDMVIVTAGNAKRCVVLLDYSSEEVFALVLKADKKLLKLKEKN